MAKVAGGCYCSAVRYEANGECSNTMVCRCQTCRRVAAAPVVARVTFPGSGFRFTKGGPKELKSCWVKFGDGLPTFQESRPRP